MRFYKIKEVKDKSQSAREQLLKAILEFFRIYQNELFTAKKITELFKLDRGHNYWYAHGLLKELETSGKLEQDHGRGFKYLPSFKQAGMSAESMNCNKEGWKQEIMDRLNKLEKAVCSDSPSFIKDKEIDMNKSDKIKYYLSEKIKDQMLETFKHLKQTELTKEKQHYFNKANQIALCIKISKLHPNNSQQYWYTLTSAEKDFLEGFKNSYIFLGFRDNKKTAYLIPFYEYRNDFLICNQTKTGWHIHINHKLQWCVPSRQKIELSLFEVPLYLEPKKVA